MNLLDFEGKRKAWWYFSLFFLQVKRINLLWFQKITYLKTIYPFYLFFCRLSKPRLADNNQRLNQGTFNNVWFGLLYFVVLGLSMKTLAGEGCWSGYTRHSVARMLFMSMFFYVHVNTLSDHWRSIAWVKNACFYLSAGVLSGCSVFGLARWNVAQFNLDFCWHFSSYQKEFLCLMPLILAFQSGFCCFSHILVRKVKKKYSDTELVWKNTSKSWRWIKSSHCLPMLMC